MLEIAQHPNILIVDDEPHILALVSKYLTKKHMKVRTANHGQAALDILAEFPADVVLSDLKMPDINGLELARKIKQQLPNTEIIILTGHGTLESAMEALREQNVFDYLIKPLDMLEELEHTIMRAFRYKQVRSQNTQLLQDLQLLNAELSQKVAQKTQELQFAYDELIEMDRLKSDFLANISHELQSPITPLEGYVGMFLEGDFGALQPEQVEILEIIQACIQRLKRQVDNILYLVMLNSENVQVILDTFSIHDVLQSMPNVFASDLADKKQLFAFNLNAEKHLVTGDLQQVSRVLNILVENALKFGPEGSTVYIKTNNISGATLLQRQQIQLEPYQLLHSFLPQNLDPDRAYLEITVQDRGKGIPLEKMPYIFHTFYQADGSLTRNASGIGLGLAIAKKILESHQSLIYIESQENIGTLASFILPNA